MGKIEIVFEKSLPKSKKFSELKAGEFFIFDTVNKTLCQRLDSGHDYSVVGIGQVWNASLLTAKVYSVDVRIFVEWMHTD